MMIIEKMKSHKIIICSIIILFIGLVIVSSVSYNNDLNITDEKNQSADISIHIRLTDENVGILITPHYPQYIEFYQGSWMVSEI